tara:strand:- start:444 stop:1292 length:849 start_codon:yes stop_codon:yes gene_type:complete
MGLHHHILALFYPIIFFFKKFSFKDSNELRVLLYHDIPKNKYDKFYNQLVFLKKSWNFISPSDFSDIISKKKILKGRNLLLTFDDGYISNKHVVEKILNPLKIKAIFFVITDFIKISDSKTARQYVSSNIYPTLKFKDVPKSYYNMNWRDLEELIKHGHSIGAHTKTHSKLSEIKTNKNLINEIVKSADEIEEKLQIKLNYFAFPFGNLESFSKDALLIANKRFDFIFSGIRGDNKNSTTKLVLHRDSIDPTFLNFTVGSFLEGSADLYYSASQKILDSWTN